MAVRVTKQIIESMQRLEELESLIKQMTKEKNALKDTLEIWMDKNDVDSITRDGFMLKKTSYTREVFDTTRFKSEYPDTYNSMKKASVCTKIEVSRV